MKIETRCAYGYFENYGNTKWNEKGSKFKVGMVKPVDQNGDYQLDANDDKIILGNKTPRWTLGWRNG